MKGLANILKTIRKEITGNIRMIGFKMKNQLHKEIKRQRKKDYSAQRDLVQHSIAKLACHDDSFLVAKPRGLIKKLHLNQINKNHLLRIFISVVEIPQILSRPRVHNIHLLPVIIIPDHKSIYFVQLIKNIGNSRKAS